MHRNGKEGTKILQIEQYVGKRLRFNRSPPN